VPSTSLRSGRRRCAIHSHTSAPITTVPITKAIGYVGKKPVSSLALSPMNR
jgi:hypothetical protein